MDILIETHNLESAGNIAEGIFNASGQESLMIQFSATQIPPEGIRCRVLQAIEDTPEAYDIARYENDKPITFLLKHEGPKNIPLVGVVAQFIKVQAEAQSGIITVKAV